MLTNRVLIFSIFLLLISKAGAQEHFRDCVDCPEMVALPSPSGSTVFAFGRTEVTQGQYRALIGNNPSGNAVCGDSCPVENVSWNDATQFVRVLSTKTGKHYRLPTSAEWSYACLAGKASEYCGGDDLQKIGWYDGNTYSTRQVASLTPNAFGLYDMSGNVWEWVEDCFDRDCSRRVERGGSYINSYRSLSSRYRTDLSSGFRSPDLGFRVVRAQK